MDAADAAPTPARTTVDDGDAPGGPADRFLWLDMEMTGLDPETCVIIEVAAIVTDVDFAPLDTFEAVVHQPPEALAGMDDWNVRTHTSSGLLDRIAGGRPLTDVEAALCELVARHFAGEPAVLAGNSIGQDRKFIDRYMPALAGLLHYRMVDVSSFKEVLRRRYGLSFDKKQRHRALGDIEESIAELAWYLTHFRVRPAGSRPTE